MKLIAKLLLFVFVSFLITPTVVCVIKKDVNISAFYSFSEEEKTQKEFKAIINHELDCDSVEILQMNCRLVFSENTSKHDNTSSKIVIPPPEQV